MAKSMARTEDVQTDMRRDLLVFEAARPQGTGGVICDPKLEIEPGCEAVIVSRSVAPFSPRSSASPPSRWSRA